MFKVNNKDTRTTPLCSSGSIVNFEQVNADWLSLLLNLNMLKLSTHPKNACSKSALKMQDHGPVSLFLNVNTYLLREIDAFFSQHFLTILQDEGLCYVRFGPLFIMQLRIASKTVMEAFITCQLICKISRKTNISYPMIRVRVSGGKKCYFFGKFCKSICCVLHEW